MIRWLATVGLQLTGLLSLAINSNAQSNLPPDIPNPIPLEEAPSLPSELPEPRSRPELQSPNNPENPVCISSPSTSPRFLVKNIEVVGNTVLQQEIAQLIKPLENREVTLEDLLCLRSEITKLYVTNGYITSGAFLPNNQDISSGEIQIQVVEGELERIEIGGLNRLREGYVRSRLERGTNKPIAQQNLQEALELLQLDPLIERVNAELTQGSSQGRSILKVNLQEAPAFHAGIGFDNYRSPSIGSYQGNIFVAHDNLTGFGDRISAQYALTEGLDNLEFNYAIPWNALDGTFSLRYQYSDSNIVEDEFERFDISSETETFSISLRQPILRSPNRELALGIGLDVGRSQTYLLGEPFSFSIGPENGESRVTALRFFQDWVNRAPTSIFAARSQFSIGIDAFDATINDTGTDGRFFSWLGQLQWVQQLSPGGTLLLARIDAQFTPDSLLPIEQISVGGVDTIRGYRQNQLVTDNGVIGGIELRIPLTSDPSVLQLTPFFEVGKGWNNDAPDPDPATLVSLGLGLRFAIASGLSLRVDYGIPLVKVDNQGDSLQENGLYFSLRYQPF